MQPKTMMTVARDAGFKSRILLTSCILLLHFQILSAPKNDSTVNKVRLRNYTTGFVAGYGLSIVGMHYLWYKDSEKQSFQFFNDNAEWKQVDKLGHFYSSFYLSAASSSLLQRCNLPARKSNLLGAATGFLILLPIEVFDGFSKNYGASTGDLIANAGGSTFFLSQQWLWNEVRLYPKFSFHTTHYPPLRPNLLGDNFVKEVLKDYNGQTYWLSADVDKFIRFPKWLNVAVGYGAHDMVYARDDQNLAFGHEAFRQYYVGLDFDLSAIRTKSKFVKALIAVSRAIKLPAPTVEFSRNRAYFHILYF